jgi:MinD-like ATPase involved in chromosome partitioning or flagellar assembly
MGAKIICMASAKGGTGKTVLTATFGTFLAALGKKVLLIDTDAATNGLTLLYFKEVALQNEYAIAENRKPKGIYELVKSNDPVEIVTLKTGVQLIPATYSYLNTESIPLDAYKSTLSKTLSSMRDSYDYIFLDAQAGSDPYAQVSISKNISDEVVIVSEYDPMSAAGVERLKGLFREDLTYVRTWVLLNKMLPDFVKSFSDFLEVAKYLSPIPWDPDVVRAYARRKLALDLDYGNEYTLAVMQTIKSLLRDTISAELQSWTKERAAVISQPIEDQYKDTEKELQTLIKEKYKFDKKNENRRSYTTILLLSTFAIMAAGIIKFTGFGTINDLPLVFIIIIIITTFILFIKSKYIDDENTDIYLSQSRIRRSQERLEERLRKLEALKAGDLETLVKYRSMNPDQSGNIK